MLDNLHHEFMMTNSGETQPQKRDQHQRNARAECRNRRLQYLRRVLRGTDYFSASEMQLRLPDLYHSYFAAVPVPALMECGAPVDGAHSENPRITPMVAALFRDVDYAKAREAWTTTAAAGDAAQRDEHGARGGISDGESQISEHDSDFESGDDEEDQGDADLKRECSKERPADQEIQGIQDAMQSCDASRPEAVESDRQPSPTTAGRLVAPSPGPSNPEILAELQRAMEERWLSGLDADFDYTVVDDNPEYDDWRAAEQDAQDTYFDAESEGEGSDNAVKCTDTGVLDY